MDLTNMLKCIWGNTSRGFSQRSTELLIQSISKFSVHKGYKQKFGTFVPCQLFRAPVQLQLSPPLQLRSVQRYWPFTRNENCCKQRMISILNPVFILSSSGAWFKFKDKYKKFESITGESYAWASATDQRIWVAQPLQFSQSL